MQIIDLTLPIHNSMFVYPGDPEVDIEQLQTLEKDDWNMKRFHINGHDGTHVNVPIHCVGDGKTLDDFKVEDFFGDCLLFESHEDIKSGKGITFKKKININIAEQIVDIKPKFVGLTKEVDKNVEKYLLNNNIILFERLTNTDLLPKEFYFYGVPLRIKEGDGSPVRAFATFNPKINVKDFSKLNSFKSAIARGWFLGHFSDIPELKTDGVEAQLVELSAGTRKKGSSFQKEARSLTMVIDGKMEVYFPEKNETVKLDKKGDFVIFSKKVLHSWTCIEDATVLTIRWPSIPDDAQNVE